MSLLYIVPVHNFSKKDKAVHQEGHSPYNAGGSKKEVCRIITDLVRCIRAHEPTASVVLHVDANFDDYEEHGLFESPVDGLYIANESLPTAYGGSHLGSICAAYQYAVRRRIEHTHVVLMTSSEMPFRTGLTLRVDRLQPRAAFWKSLAMPNTVKYARAMLEQYNMHRLGHWLIMPTRTVFHSQVEGCVFETGVLRQVVEVLTEFYDNKTLNSPPMYLEELLIPTIASQIVGKDYEQPMEPVTLFYVGQGHQPMDLNDLRYVVDAYIHGGSIGRCWGPNNPQFLGIKQKADDVFMVKRVERREKDPVRVALMDLAGRKSSDPSG